MVTSAVLAPSTSATTSSVPVSDAIGNNGGKRRARTNKRRVPLPSRKDDASEKITRLADAKFNYFQRKRELKLKRHDMLVKQHEMFAKEH